jgi:hypothetical protein
MAKYIRTSSQKIVLENLMGQTNQFQSDLDKFTIEVRATNQGWMYVGPWILKNSVFR